ncbi:Nucleic-acid-binding protein from mobile element jockey [Araneus ventricosus]|uniref:Nucleic-acid-binding protein from mobile element jockey n=1 Tax=Araneus ventricosus TaxID=182803 RepID=A0A4Y2G4T0_ARAVE|nr:Nucleic-acid-binding protein from mobile element jockey [Araneus ventricosus]
MYKNIQEFCKENEYEYHVIIPKNERPFRVVFKGLGLEYDTEKLKSILNNQGFQVTKAIRLTQQRNRQPLPFYLVELVKTPNVEEIYKVNRIGILKTEVEEFRARKQITQCFNCNGFGHSATGCGYRPRCLKCEGAHRTNQCTIKERVENPKCINCGKIGHVAAYRGCEKFPKLEKTQQNKINTLRPFSSTRSVIKENVSFSQLFKTQKQQPMAAPTSVSEFPNINNQEITAIKNDLTVIFSTLREIQ